MEHLQGPCSIAAIEITAKEVHPGPAFGRDHLISFEVGEL